jgi:hypothetical protein
VTSKAGFTEREGCHQFFIECVFFLCPELPRVLSDFDAELDRCMGPDEKKCIIAEPASGLLLRNCVDNNPISNTDIMLRYRSVRFLSGKGGKGLDRVPQSLVHCCVKENYEQV